MDHIHIVTISNNQYAKYITVMLNSLLVNKHSKNEITVHVIGELNKENKTKVRKSLEKYKTNLEFYSVNPNIFSGFKEVGHLRKEVYYKLLIPELLASNIMKAIYLDGDIIVREDITNLWNIPIDDYYLAAVKGVGVDKSRFRALSIPYTAGYFNAGVMVLNLKKWRDTNTSAKVIHYLRKNEKRILWLEQDALNAVLYDNWLKLNPKWNVTTTLAKKIRRDRKKGISHKNFKPAILHFTGNKKPWMKTYKYKTEYSKYLEITTWED